MILRTIYVAAMLLVPPTLNAHGLGFFGNLRAAADVASARQTLLLIFFTASDWGLLTHELDIKVWEDPAFAGWANENYSLYLADYPQRVKQDAARLKFLKSLAERFEVRHFPTIVGVTPDLQLLGKHEYRGEGGSEILGLTEQWREKFEERIATESTSKKENTTK
ncbi:MAG TPA: hypothetical protein VD994_15670 [Prosthecobacter sp.]|nr:hypothetical protein [Prosthecobacter sp.]